MDPNETLRQLREYVRAWENDELLASSPDGRNEVLELFSALDQWLSKGGFSPWDKPESR